MNTYNRYQQIITASGGHVTQASFDYANKAAACMDSQMRRRFTRPSVE